MGFFCMGGTGWHRHCDGAFRRGLPRLRLPWLAAIAGGIAASPAEIAKWIGRAGARSLRVPLFVRGTDEFSDGGGEFEERLPRRLRLRFRDRLGEVQIARYFPG